MYVHRGPNDDAANAVPVNGKGIEAAPRRPLVSVCVPMYNNANTIGRCLGSILDQSGVNFEIVVVDDDSSDDSVAIAETMLRPRDRLMRNRPRLGLNQNHNRCLELARGDLIQMVHGDDWLLPGALLTLAQCFEEPTVGLAFAPRHVVGDDESFKRRYGRLHAHFRKLQAVNDGRSLALQLAVRGAKSNWIGEPTCVMFRRELALHAGGFRDDIYQLVDLDLWLRLMLRSVVRFVPHELSVRSHTVGTASTGNVATRRYWLDQLRILTSLIVDPASPPAVRIVAGLWWLPSWLGLPLEAAVFGPQRWWRLKTIALAPSREFTHARRLFRGFAAGALDGAS